MVGAPGYGFRQLLDRLDDGAVSQLIRPDVRQLLNLIDSSILTGDHLRKFVRQSRPSRQYILDASTRNLLLVGLPRAKADELCRALGIKSLSDPYIALSQVTPSTGSADEAILLDFFGAEPPVKRERVRNSVGSANANYALFGYQRQVAREVCLRLNAPPHRLILHMPTGGGKTRTTMNVISEHLREHEPTVVVWLAYSRELLEQAASEFEKSWSYLGNRPLPVYRYWGETDGDPLDLHDGLIVAGLGKLHAWSMRAINSLPSLADRVTLTVIDEAHQSIATTYASMLELLATKRWGSRLLGLTATPGRTWSDIGEDARLADFFGRQKAGLHIEGYSNPVTYLIDKGYLARPVFRTLNIQAGLELSHDDIRQLRTDLEVPLHVLSQLAEDQTRNLKIVSEVEALLSRHVRVIVFATTVDHAELVAAVLGARGHEASAVTASTPEHQRRSVLQRYTANTSAPMAICNYGVLTAGFDAPRTSAALIARPTKSLVLYSQMVGRAIRGTLAGGNATAEVVTVIDPSVPGFGDVAQAFENWEDVWQTM